MYVWHDFCWLFKWGDGDKNRIILWEVNPKTWKVRVSCILNYHDLQMSLEWVTSFTKSHGLMESIDLLNFNMDGWVFLWWHKRIYLKYDNYYIVYIWSQCSIRKWFQICRLSLRVQGIANQVGLFFPHYFFCLAKKFMCLLCLLCGLSSKITVAYFGS